MVFENLTLFEIQVDDARFGSRTTPGHDDRDDEREPAESSGRSRLLPVLLFVLLAVGAAMYYRRSGSTDVERHAGPGEPEADVSTDVSAAE